MGTQLEEEGVIVAEVGGIAASEDKDFVLSDLAGGVIRAGHGRVSSALLESPLHRCVVDDPDRIQVILGEQLRGIRQRLGLFKTSEHVMEFSNGHDGVTRNRRRCLPSLFDLLPRDRRRLS